MVAVNEKYRWIRSYEWIGSIDGNPLPYSEADFKVDFTIEKGLATVVIKRAICERNTLRRIVMDRGPHLVVLESKPRHSKNDHLPAVMLELFGAGVSAYWLEDTEAGSGQMVRDVYAERRVALASVSEETAELVTAIISNDFARHDRIGDAWDDIDPDIRKEIVENWAALITTPQETPSLTERTRREVYKLHLPQQSPREAPGIDAKSSGITMECIEFTSDDFGMK